ncbi:protein ENHANCED DOWNY MILDEW 2-like isoform X2 [Magnolia sinica]|uniref:protein ENHANCED DOWNY MILDEW 2-like isoform X2 n=1 Tax=Magnolia sinica TaxID=86752 RepID=UPI0026587A0B|nr:protein ENHANCED DOWNY MILDEW 2-like isoform X2 [Magnolia sinica]
MESSDDEGVGIPEAVTNYHFVDDKDELIPFSVLPIQWGEDESPESTEKQVFLHGTADDGLQKIYKQVTAWKLDLSEEQPEVSVLSKENSWIKLQKPRKSFDDTIRTILITIHCLHFARVNLEASEKALWDHLRKVFSLYEIRPSENDLFDHVPLIRDMVKRDEELAKSKFLLAYLERPKKRKASDEDIHSLDAKKSKFIVDDNEDIDEEIEDADADESDEESDLFDSVCAICDNGGELLCCEGRCLRSFHATKDAGADSACKSLGMSKAQVKAIQNFLCANCQYKRHQCFFCGKLGSSDKSSNAEVFPCVSATCGHFYHPECVAKLLHPGNDAEAEEHKKEIAAGEPFTCPVHKCLVCKQGENKEVEELQFALCRRCPKAYHRKCLPRKISFEDSEDEGIVQRAWDDLIPNRILIYCLKHKIEEDIGTPIRNHIIFPYTGEKKKVRPSDSQSGKEKILVKRKDSVFEDIRKDRLATKTTTKLGKGSFPIKESDSPINSEKRLSRQGSDLPKKSTTLDASRKLLKDGSKAVSIKAEKSTLAEESRTFVREEKSPVNSKTKDMSTSKLEKILSPTGIKKSSSPLPVADVETEKKIMALIRKSASSLSLEDITSKHKLPSTHSYSSRNVDKTITQGKVERFVEAVRTALQKLEGGGSIEDAKAVCEPEILTQIIKWKNKLKVYLAPFLHGMRYTSFGRHFTKVDKLKEIVDKLHWYVQNGDTIVDFCCGSNDFSLLMRDKLQESGKQCSFKNFDVIQPKNDFSFEKRDWMTVRPRELPTGSQLIMGLNPPFGVKAGLANKFIDKALEFKPKLLILIVPKETERLDEKKQSPYDLLWEDGEKLSGKSFYLPGSVDVNDKQMDQWNLKPPLLYLWSRPDWTERNKAIGIKQGHISKEQEAKQGHISKEQEAKQGHISKEQEAASIEESHKETPALEQAAEDHDFYGGLSKIINDMPILNDQAEVVPEQAGVVSFEEDMEISPSRSPKYNGLDGPRRHEGDGDGGGREKNGHGREMSQENSKERRGRKGKRARMKARMSENRTSPRISSPPKRTDSRNILEAQPLEPFENRLERAGSEEGFRHFDLGLPGSGSDFGIGYGLQPSIPDDDLKDIERRYSSNRDDQFASGPHKWTSSGSLSLSGGGIQSIEEALPGYVRDRNVDTFSRNPYTDDLSMAEKYARTTDLRRHIHMFGQQGYPDDLAQRNHQYQLERSSGPGQLGSLSSSPGIGQLGSLSSNPGLSQPGLLPLPFGFSSMSAEPSRMGSSVTQRYAPRLDETNYARSRSPLRPEVPLAPGMGSIFDTAPGSRSGFHADPRGFAPGPHRTFQHQGSSGWLDE